MRSGLPVFATCAGMILLAERLALELREQLLLDGPRAGFAEVDVAEVDETPGRGGREAGARLAGGLGVSAHARVSSKLAISTATRAASRPFSSARAQAWASFSTVRMALAIGRW